MSYEHLVINNTFLQLSAGINSGATVLNFTAGHGLRLPVIAAPKFMFATLVRVATGELERVKITIHNSAADSATVVRGQDDTTPLTFSAGDRLECRIGKNDWDQLPRVGFLEAILGAGGSAEAITASLLETGLQGTTIPDGFTIGLLGTSANMGSAPTLELTLPDGTTGAKTIVKGNQSPLAGGDIGPFPWLQFKTSFNQWVLLNPVYGHLQAGDYIDAGTPNLSRTGFLVPDGSTFSRSNIALLNALVRRATFTVTIASPGVVTWNAHGLIDNEQVTLATTGALPTGIGINTVYYVKVIDANTFNLAATPGGAAINTSGGQSGTHTITYYPHGAGDGSTTAHLPNLSGRARIGQGAGSVVISVDAAQVDFATNDHFTIPSNVDTIITGLKGQFTTTGGLPAGLSPATDYWLVRTSATTFKVATSLANAQNGTVINLTSAGTGVHTFTSTLSTRAVGRKGGEEAHAMSSTELLAHIHSGVLLNGGGNGQFEVGGAAVTSMGSAGGNAAMNNMQPFDVAAVFIKT